MRGGRVSAHPRKITAGIVGQNKRRTPECVRRVPVRFDNAYGCGQGVGSLNG